MKLGQSEDKSRNWLAIVLGVIVAILAAVTGFSIASSNQEARRRIEAQNRIAEQSEVIREKDRLWSRLATQYDNLEERVRERDLQFAQMLEDRDERILALSETVANIRPVRVVVRQPVQTDTPDGRSRVSFDETVPPVRVSGYTLTNPPEAEMEVSFPEPLRLRTTVVQRDDGSWRSYFDANWDNVEIEDIETSVSPLPDVLPRARERIVLGANASIAPTRAFDTFSGNVYLLVETKTRRSFAMGPNVGMTTIAGESRFNVGLTFQWRPWGSRR